jgi:hypothetical protein
MFACSKVAVLCEQSLVGQCSGAQVPTQIKIWYILVPCAPLEKTAVQILSPLQICQNAYTSAYSAKNGRFLTRNS